MPFWRKEDPWDVDPEKRRRQSEKRLAEEEGQSPAGALKDKLLDAVAGEAGGGESLKDAASKAKGKILSALSLEDGEKKAEEPEPEPMTCPWCGKPMARRYLTGGRGVWLSTKKPGFFSSAFSSDSRDLLDEGNPLTSMYKIIWYCDGCEKIAAELPPLPEYHSIYDQPPAEPDAGTEARPEEKGDAP